jgi:hypothetical protein
MKRLISILAVLSALSATAFGQTVASSKKDASVVQPPTTTAKPIAIQKLDLVPPIATAKGQVQTREVLPGDIEGVTTHLVSIQGPGQHVEPQRMTVARLLKSAGYDTACFGKWHLGFCDKAPDWNGELKPGPLELGFDYYFGLPVMSCIPPYVYVENHRGLGLDPADPLSWGPKATGPTYAKVYPAKGGEAIFHGGKAAHELFRDEEVCSNLTARAVRWINEHKQKPFFLYFATTNLHHLFTPHPRFRGTSQCGLYGDFVQEFDWAVGENGRGKQSGIKGRPFERMNRSTFPSRQVFLIRHSASVEWEIDLSRKKPHGRGRAAHP